MASPVNAFAPLSVVIPAYNAERTVAQTLDDVQGWLDSEGVSHEVLVVDDGSSDRTAEVVESRGRGVRVIRMGANGGKGKAVRHGMLEARGAWAMFMDVDNSTNIRHLERFAPHAPHAQVLIASRRLEGSKIVRPQHKIRQALGRTFPRVVRLVALPDLEDTQCGFKVFRADVAKQIFSRARVDRFAFDVEVLLLAKRLGAAILQVPVDWDNPVSSTLVVRKDSVAMLRDVLITAHRLRPSAWEREAQQAGNLSHK